jgi:DNA topoisomerase-3
VELAPPDAYDERYTKWRYEDLPIIPPKWKYTVPKGKEKQLKVLSDLMNRADVDTVVNACDAGREGEHIFRLAYAHSLSDKPVKRLWISSLEESAIQKGLSSLKDGSDYDRLYAAAQCRAQADWLVGMNASRVFSLAYNATLNVGRVQTPTLAMLVEREMKINSFVKESFYTPAIESAGFKAYGDKMSARQDAEKIQADCEGKPAHVQSVEKQTKTAAPPNLYDLTTLQREANRLLGFTAEQTLGYAQSLYEKRLLSYPRTTSRFLTSEMSNTASAVIDWLMLNIEY